MDIRELTGRQKRFVEEYLVDFNGRQAAIRAGYAQSTADKKSYALLNNCKIKEQISVLLEEKSKRTAVNADRIINELAKIAFVNPEDVINLNEGTIKEVAKRDSVATISSVRVKVVPTANGDRTERDVKLYDKTKALELLGKHFGMFNDRLKPDGGISADSPVIISGEEGLEDLEDLEDSEDLEDLEDSKE